MSDTSKTDWARVKSLGDSDIDTADIPPLTQAFFAKATIRVPRTPIEVTLHVDPDLLAWFQAQGPTCEQRINAALRLYVEAHRDEGL
jgi:uncharacterized protein (DUF4415 family)